MTTASVQDIDTFIRLQKEKLNRDKFNDFNPNQVIIKNLLNYILKFKYIKKLKFFILNSQNKPLIKLNKKLYFYKIFKMRSFVINFFIWK